MSCIISETTSGGQPFEHRRTSCWLSRTGQNWTLGCLCASRKCQAKRSLCSVPSHGMITSGSWVQCHVNRVPLKVGPHKIGAKYEFFEMISFMCGMRENDIPAGLPLEACFSVIRRGRYVAFRCAGYDALPFKQAGTSRRVGFSSTRALGGQLVYTRTWGSPLAYSPIAHGP